MVSVSELISARTRVCGLLGYPVEHSFSPAMHNAAFRHLGLDFVYLAFPVHPERLEEAVAGVRALHLAGVNVTVPHKEKVIPYLDELTDGARLAGAVNTIVHREGHLVGHNTDGAGFVRFLTADAGFNPAGKRVLVLGAGGAARAVAVHLALAGVEQVLVANRTPSRAAELAALIHDQTPARACAVPWPADVLPGEVDLIVQTTPLGMHPRVDACPDFPFHRLRPEQVVVDLVYNPPRTLFMERAARSGARVYNGLGMLLYQGVLAFELWTGERAPVEVMRRALPF
ncbi:shikimate dehydrogenase [Desulfofundulus australicus DSM 11792]|uniref:Shikimate dehydrogenase (NADP(+)) n=1 Tax=Desulfofundulus australicus DSM 11792 TaxID=1121425 RepID=A0A1M4YBU7_9FIRM|nr:shikimate dehydrogenase [Desulfofundulus australicus]SHF03053.1 shikimate dehydrogenase [Desulfofundulus australicus DSM 11792]